MDTSLIVILLMGAGFTFAGLMILIAGRRKAERPPTLHRMPNTLGHGGMYGAGLEPAPDSHSLNAQYEAWKAARNKANAPVNVLEPVPQIPDGNLRDDLAQRRAVQRMHDEERERRRRRAERLIEEEKTERRRRADEDFWPSISDIPYPGHASTQPERLVPRQDPPAVKRDDDDMARGTGFVTGGSFGGEGFSSGPSDSPSSDTGSCSND
jgi:hypothetical protein